MRCSELGMASRSRWLLRPISRFSTLALLIFSRYKALPRASCERKPIKPVVMSPVAHNPISSIERGSVYLLARWSGPSVAALQLLRAAWSAAGLPESELHILDWDEHSYLGDLPELSGRVHGWGEAFHVRHGSITHFHILGRNRATTNDEIQTFIQQTGNA